MPVVTPYPEREIDVQSYSNSLRQKAIYLYVIIPPRIRKIQLLEDVTLLRAWRMYYCGKLSRVAERVGIDISRFGELERSGKRGCRIKKPTLREIAKLCQYYRTHPNCLFSDIEVDYDSLQELFE